MLGPYRTVDLDQCCAAASLKDDVRLTPLQSLGNDDSEQPPGAALSCCAYSFHRRHSWQVHIPMLPAKKHDLWTDTAVENSSQNYHLVVEGI